MLISYKLVIVLTCFLTALITGLFYAYSCSVNPGLAKLKDLEYLRAMQSINKAILNPLFFLGFLGTLVLLPLGLWILFRAQGTSVNFYFLLAATLTYLVGVFGITMFGNVPLNNSLEKFVINAADHDSLRSMRATFEQPWNRLHSLRTVFAAVALLLALIAAIIKFD